MQNILKTFLLVFLIMRPVIDLFWDKPFLGLNPAQILGVLLFFCTIIVIFIKKITIRPLSLFFLTFLVFLSNLLFNQYVFSWSSFLRFYSPMIYLVYFWNNTVNLKKAELFMKWFIWISLIPIAIAYFQYFGLIPYTYWDWLSTLGSVGRASGGYHHPTSLNRILIFTILFSLYFIYTSKNIIKYITYIVLALFPILFSYHRTTYIIVPLIFLIWYSGIFKKYAKKIIVAIIFAAIFTSCIIFIAKYSPVKITDLFNQESIGSFHGREYRFNKIFELYQKLPLINKLLGNGGDFYKNGTILRCLDNDFLNFLWRYGIIGVFLWIIVIIDFLKSTYIVKIFHNSKDYFFNKVARIGFICYLMFGIIVEISFVPNFMCIVYSLYAINQNNIAHNYNNTELRRLNRNLYIILIMLVAIFCCCLLYYLLNSVFRYLPYFNM